MPVIRMAQTWRDLLFAHWRVDIVQLRPWIPEDLEIDLFEGEAWVAVVPFRMTDIHFVGTPALPYLSRTLELNLRTYVRLRGQPDSKPGVFFFSLDAASPVAVRIARRFFHLPYFDAAMNSSEDARGFQFGSTRKGAKDVRFGCRYRPTGAIFRSGAGSLEEFLTERYCFYTTGRDGTVYRGDIAHDPWPLQPAEAEFTENGLTIPWRIDLPQQEPLLHFAKRVSITTMGIARVYANRRI